MTRPVIVIAANAAWNLVNFRSGLITALMGHGYDVVGAAPPDARAEDGLRTLGARFAPLEGVGHWWPYEAPEAGAAALTSFWASLD